MKSKMLEPAWDKKLNSLPNSISFTLKSWLIDGGSTTKHCKNSFREFEIKVLREAFESPFKSEIKVLETKNDCFVRHVFLNCDEKPWIFGRLVVPEVTLEVYKNELLNLGNKPLGEFLFKQPSLKRSDFCFAKTEEKHKNYCVELGIKNNLWGRRSLFYLENLPLLLTEFFDENTII